MTELPIEIDVQAVQALRQQGIPFLLLDVRNPDEYATAKIEGSQLIPMNEMQQRLGEIESQKDQRVIVHCHHGGRSMRVTMFLKQQGFSQVQNMAGGIDAWSQQIDAQVPRY
jgi:rhodanese-related sulfurtransferase